MALQSLGLSDEAFLYAEPSLDLWMAAPLSDQSALRWLPDNDYVPPVVVVRSLAVGLSDQADLRWLPEFDTALVGVIDAGSVLSATLLCEFTAAESNTSLLYAEPELELSVSLELSSVPSLSAPLLVRTPLASTLLPSRSALSGVPVVSSRLSAGLYAASQAAFRPVVAADLSAALASDSGMSSAPSSIVALGVDLSGAWTASGVLAVASQISSAMASEARAAFSPVFHVDLSADLTADLSFQAGVVAAGELSAALVTTASIGPLPRLPAALSTEVKSSAQFYAAPVLDRMSAAHLKPVFRGAGITLRPVLDLGFGAAASAVATLAGRPVVSAATSPVFDFPAGRDLVITAQPRAWRVTATSGVVAHRGGRRAR